MKNALVTGATGFIGQRVVLALVEQGWKVKCLCRSREKAMTMPWAKHVEQGAVVIVEGDASKRADVEQALESVDCAWYLLHSMSSGSGFAEQEATMAKQFGEVAAEQSVGRIVYLGGLHPDSGEMSEHLESRVRVGEKLRAAGVPTAALQAGVVIGDGSLSFELLRHVSERVPAFVAPGWINNRITPISVRDVVYYLVAAAGLPPEQDRAFDIGGPDTMPYVDMMQRYADTVGLRRRPFLTAPVMTRRLASLGLSLLTPLSMGKILPIFDSVSADTVVKERDLEELVGTPEGGNQSFEEAVAIAARDTDPHRYGRIAKAVGAGVIATAVAGSILTNPNGRMYKRLKKPRWQPASTVFPIAWTLLYTDIALVGTTTIADSHDKSDALALAGNLALNAGWTGVFFRSKRRGLATVWAAALAASSADLVRRAHRQSPPRAWLLAPYPLWCTFATALTGRIAQLNRS